MWGKERRAAVKGNQLQVTDTLDFETLRTGKENVTHAG